MLTGAGMRPGGNGATVPEENMRKCVCRWIGGLPEYYLVLIQFVQVAVTTRKYSF
jgi:hypothetical protein